MVRRLIEVLKIYPAIHFVKHWIKWRRSGGKLRPQEEIEDIYSICSRCPEAAEFEDDEVQCTLCHCFVNKERNMWNKAAWTTERCPLANPKWVESPPIEGSSGQK